MGWMYLLLVLSLLIVILISGCIQEIKNLIKCEPNWILTNEYLTDEEYCKSSCYNVYRVTSYRFEPTYHYKCSCITSRNLTRWSWIEIGESCFSYCENEYENVFNSWTELKGNFLKCYCFYSFETTLDMGIKDNEEQCLNECKIHESDEVKVIDFKTEKMLSMTSKCYCDTNNCNPE